jgi:ADP-heptose:LPS heptosyltransferase
MRIAVVRALPGLGDLLCAVPALRALRAAHRDAHVAHIGLEAGRLLTDRFPDYVDELLPFPGFPGLPELPLDPRATTAFLQRAQAQPFDLALQLHGSGVASNAFTLLLGARRTAGAHPRHQPSPGPDFVEDDERAPEPRRLLRVLEHIGIPARGEHLEFPVSAGDEEQAASHGVRPKTYACIHAGASVPERRWPAADFARVADGLADHGLRIVLTGTDAERPITQAVGDHATADVLDLAGRTSLGATAALLRDSAITITNDTGTSHLAAAVGARSVILAFSDPERWAPLDRELHHSLFPAPQITPRQVLERAQSLLHESAAID